MSTIDKGVSMPVNLLLRGAVSQARGLVRLNRIMLAAALVLPLGVHAASANCSIKPKRTLSKNEQRAVAKVRPEVAMRIALDKVGISGSIIHAGSLEVEDGCLIYSYDVKLPKKGGFEEVIIDAGTGEVLGVEHESDAKEAAEAEGR